MFSRKKEFDTVKILTVRDANGRIVEDAKTVEVWKTSENILKTYDIIGKDWRKCFDSTLVEKILYFLEFSMQALRELNITDKIEINSELYILKNMGPSWLKSNFSKWKRIKRFIFNDNEDNVLFLFET